jgi:hypothetical protein
VVGKMVLLISGQFVGRMLFGFKISLKYLKNAELGSGFGSKIAYLDGLLLKNVGGVEHGPLKILKIGALTLKM